MKPSFSYKKAYKLTDALGYGILSLRKKDTSMIKGIVGCYQNNKSMVNVVGFEFDEQLNKFIKSYPLVDWQDAKYLSIDNNYLVSLANNGKGGVCVLNVNTQQINYQFDQESTPCYVTQTLNYIYTANYHTGKVMVYQKDKLLTPVKCIDTGVNSGAHQILIYHQLLLVPCLLLDQIRIYDIENDYSLISEINFENHTGVRHGVFVDNHLYIISELSNQLFHLIINSNGDYQFIEHMDLLPDGLQGACAAIRLSNDHNYLYVSIRQCNLIKVIDVNKFAVIQSISCQGDHPRDIALTPDNNYLFVANRYTNQLHSFPIDKCTGLLGELVDSLEIIDGVSIEFFSKETNYDL